MHILTIKKWIIWNKENKKKVSEIGKLNWASRGYSPVVECSIVALTEKGHFFLVILRKRSLGEPTDVTVRCFFFWLWVGLIWGVLAALVALG